MMCLYKRNVRRDLSLFIMLGVRDIYQALAYRSFLQGYNAARQNKLARQFQTTINRNKQQVQVYRKSLYNDFHCIQRHADNLEVDKKIT